MNLTFYHESWPDGHSYRKQRLALEALTAKKFPTFTSSDPSTILQEGKDTKEFFKLAVEEKALDLTLTSVVRGMHWINEAAYFMDIGVMEVLLEAKADINQRSTYYESTPLFALAMALLHTKGDKAPPTILAKAATAIKWLLEHKADPKLGITNTNVFGGPLVEGRLPGDLIRSFCTKDMQALATLIDGGK